MSCGLKKLESLVKENLGFCFGLGIGLSTFFIDYNLTKYFEGVSNLKEFFELPYKYISSFFEFGLPITLGSILDKKNKALEQKNEELEEILSGTQEIYQTMKNYLYSFFENMPMPAYVLDKDLNLTRANTLGKEYLGLLKKEHYTLESLLSLEKDRLSKIVKNISEHKKLYSFNKEFLVDNKKKDAKVFVFPVYDLKENLENIVVLLVDMTSEVLMRKDLEETLKHLIRLTTLSIDVKDHYTYDHSLHVANYSLQIAKAYNMEVENSVDLNKIYYAGLLHDIGKVFVRDEILKKKGKLTPEEFEEIKQHTVHGYRILKDIKHLEPIPIWIRYHHENWDGTGYEGLIGGDIPLESRILRIADVFDALVTERPYKKALSHDEAYEFVVQNLGKLFDPQLVEIFSKLYPRLLEVKDESFEVVKLFDSY